jgi:hypothetical protein
MARRGELCMAHLARGGGRGRGRSDGVADRSWRGLQALRELPKGASHAWAGHVLELLAPFPAGVLAPSHERQGLWWARDGESIMTAGCSVRYTGTTATVLYDGPAQQGGIIFLSCFIFYLFLSRLIIVTFLFYFLSYSFFSSYNSSPF